MGSIINTNIAAIRTHNVYNRNDINMNAALTRVATGMKINSAKDGASTWAISEKMRERIRANDQANQNVQNDTALLKTAQGGVSNTIDILKTLKERAINAANDSNMNTDRDRIATEVEQLLEQINDNAAKVKFNGRTLLDGTGATDKTGGAFKTNEVAATDEITDDISSQRAISKISVDFSNIFNGLSTTSTSPVNVTATIPFVNFTGNNNASSAGFAVDGTGSVIKTTDKLVISWTDSNGETQKSKEVTVGSALNFNTLKDQDWGDGITVKALAYDSTAGADNHILDENDNRITDSDGNDLELASDNSMDGLYVIGSDGVAKDIKLTVYASDGTENTNGTAFFSTTAVQTAAVSSSSSAGTADIQGDHAIFGFKGLTGANGADLDVGSTGTQLKDLELDGESLFGDTPDKVKFTYGAGDDDYVELNGTDKLSDLIAALDAKGINAQVLGKDDQYRDVDDNQVLKTGYTVAETRAEEAGLYFVSGAASDDYDPSTFTGITITATDSNNEDVEVSGGVASAIMEYKDPNAVEEVETPSTSLTFYIGGEQNFGITANLSSMKVEDLFSGYDSNSFANLFTDQKTAETALDKINTALDTALNEQTKLGALEARLGYTSDNLTTMNENLEAADSTMRDSDIAKEMTNYMKYSVLAQASQYMLAQSSQNAFSVLNLLQA